MSKTEHPDRVLHMRTRLTEALSPIHLEIIDESHKHIGHAGASGGGGHYMIKICAAAFEGKSLVSSHKLVYQALGDMMKKEIHALKIQIIKT